MPKHLIMGAVSSTLLWEQIAPFCNSYSQAGFDNCECIIFNGEMPQSMLNKIHSRGIKTIPIPERFDGQLINNFRWEMFRDYLSERVNDYDIVFTVGCRDVIFQSDLFKYYENTGKFLGVALEDGKLTEPYNKKWLVQRYGVEVWESMKDQRALCSDTIWGTAQEFLVFLSAMVEHINSDQYPSFYGVDQAAENWLVYHENVLCDIIRTNSNKDGYIMTVATTDQKDIHVDSAGNVLNGKGEIAAVVHQYDRKPLLRNIVSKRYSSGMSCFGKRYLKDMDCLYARSYSFVQRARRYGLIRTIIDAIQRRIHKKKSV